MGSDHPAVGVVRGLVCREEIVWTDLAVADDTDDGKPEKAGPHRRALNRSWTSPVYLRRAAAVVRAQRNTDAGVAEVRARVLHEREAQARRRRALVEQLERDKRRHEANRAALRERQQRLMPVVVRQVTEQTGTRVWPLDGDPDYAMGVSILAGGRIVAVICPAASRITNETAQSLADVVVLMSLTHRPDPPSRQSPRMDGGCSVDGVSRSRKDLPTRGEGHRR